MRFLKKQIYDKLTVEVNVEVSQIYKNVSKYKRVLTPVIHENVYLYVNEIRINEDAEKVFVIEEFFDSLTREGEFPMFTCSCLDFGCGGFYIDIYHKGGSVIWVTKESAYKEHIFDRENIQVVAEKLIDKLFEINELRKQKNLQVYHDIQAYRSQLDVFLNKTKGESN